MEVSKNSIFLQFEPGLQNIMISDKTLEYKKQNSPMIISVQFLISKQCYHDADEGDEVLHTEFSNDTEKKGGSPMYQLLGQLLSNEINDSTVLGNN